MVKPSEIICCAILVRDFVRFSHYYESNQALQKYALQEFGIDVSSTNALLTGLSKEVAIAQNNLFDAMDAIEQVMPFSADVPSPVRSHFEQRDVGTVAYFAPEHLFSGNINIPEALPLDCSGLVKVAIQHVKEHINDSLREGISVNALLSVLEDWCSYFSLDSGRTSFFEYLKLKAGNGTIILHNMADHSFANTSVNNILTCSFDFLGIKDFKFQELFENDLHQMKAASLYIDLFRENVLDEFLDAADLTRANVIFSGGRHIHLYLPNTAGIKQMIPRFIAKINDWCVSLFKTQLYVSYGYEAVSGHALSAKSRKKDLYLNTFVNIANMKADVESAKYSPANIVTINDLNNSDNYLSFKKAFRTMISSLAKMMVDSPDLRISVCDSPAGLPIFPGKYILLGNEQCNICRGYVSKTSFREKHGSDVGIWMDLMGFDYSFSELTHSSAFPSFVGVLRADIDDFRKEMLMYGERESTYLRDPISEMMLSKEFAIFLRYYIYLLAQKYIHIVVLHEGADDVFVVGSVEDILAFSEEFAHTYRIYTNNCMTISAGISIYSIGNKFISAANEAQELMNVSKAVPGKNAIAAFFSDSVTKWGNFNSSECLRQLSSKEH